MAVVTLFHYLAPREQVVRAGKRYGAPLCAEACATACALLAPCICYGTYAVLAPGICDGYERLVLKLGIWYGSLVRVLKNNRETQYLVLANVATLVQHRKDMFAGVSFQSRVERQVLSRSRKFLCRSLLSRRLDVEVSATQSLEVDLSTSLSRSRDVFVKSTSLCLSLVG